ncbi:MAG: putative baseplate assembly protein [Myxococcota bacterium]
MIPTPNLDDRKFEDIVDEAIRLIPQYCPEWTNFNKADPGITLLELFAWMTEMVIYRLNRVPENNYLAFLNMMGIRLQPPQPARTIVRFAISEKTDLVNIPAGTRIATQPEGDTPAMVFETERDLMGLSNRLVRCMSQHAKTFQDNSSAIDGEGPAFEVFGGARSIERYLYLGDERFGSFNESSILIARFEAQSAGDRQFHELLEWEYWDGNRWREMSRPSMDLERNTTAFNGPPVFAMTSINDVETFWIRGRLFEVPRVEEETVIDTISARIEVLGEGIRPEFAISNPEGETYANLDLDKNFAPFGKEPRVDSTFYFGSKEGLVQPNTKIRIDFTLSDQQVADVARPSPDLTLRWEYHTGKRWKVLGRVKFSEGVIETENGFIDGTRCFTSNGSILFARPKDMGEAEVQAVTTFWVRCRIESGNFGQPGTYVLEDDTWIWKEENPLRPPWFRDVTFKFQEDPHPVKHVLVYNDFVFTDQSKLAATEYKPFQVFQPVAEESPTLYLGWEAPFPNDTCAVYFNVLEFEGKGGRASLRAFDDRTETYIEQRVVWEYWNGKSWSALAPRDTTENFTKAGFIEFIGPPDFRSSRRFGESLHWMRARLEMGGYDEPPRCNRVMLNAVHAQNVTTFGDTLLGASAGTPNQFFHFPRGPVLDGEVVVIREQDMPSPAELEELGQLWGTDKLAEPDADFGGFWIRWQSVDSLYDKGPRDRCYIKDIVSGELRFGDGVRGMIPPKGDKNVRARMYRVGGGQLGNVPALSISQLVKPIAFVTEVSNPYPAAGGADMETVEEAKTRAPHMLKARNRAVTVDDFEWLAREASNSVARVKCLPSTSREGEVTVIVVPRSSGADEMTEKPVPTVELLKRVRQYLNQRRLVSTVVNVVRPSYVECSLRIEIVASQRGGASDKIKKSIEKEIRRFLHPLKGWRGGKGWPFGRSLLKVDLYQVVESVDGVDLVDKIRIFDEDRGGVEVEQLRVEEDQLVHLVNVTVVEKAHDRIV